MKIDKRFAVKLIIITLLIAAAAGIKPLYDYFGNYNAVITDWFSLWSIQSPDDIVISDTGNLSQEDKALIGDWRGTWAGGNDGGIVVKELKNNKADIYFWWDSFLEELSKGSLDYSAFNKDKADEKSGNKKNYIRIMKGAVEFTAGLRKVNGKQIIEWTADTKNKKEKYTFTFNYKMNTFEGVITNLQSNSISGEISLHKTPVNNASNPGSAYREFSAVQSADWIKNAVIYEVFPRVFTGQKGFAGMSEKLPYLKKLGVNTIWLMPIHEIGIKNKKGSLGCPYSVRDYYSINHEYGTKTDFRNFINLAHNEGFKVIIDWVVNHSAWDNELINIHPQWYTKNDKGRITPPENTDWTDAADFNFGAAGLQDYLTNAMKYWVKDFGVDGFRCDAAEMIPLEFWEKSRKDLKKINPEVLLLAESEEKIHNAKAFDLTYESSMRGMISQIIRKNRGQNDFAQTIIQSKYSFPKNSLRMRWLENHDNYRSIKYFGDDAIYPAATALLTMDGVPLIFMGQEFGDKKWVNWHSLFDPLQLDWDNFNIRLFDHYRKLINIRKSSAAFTDGSVETIKNNEEKVISYLRSRDNHNLEDIINHKISGKRKIENLLLDIPATEQVSSLDKKRFTMKAFESAVYKIEDLQK